MAKIYKIKPFIDIEVFAIFDRQQWVKYCKKLGIESQAFTRRGEALFTDEDKIIFAAGIFENDLITCIHESTHITDYIMSYLCIKDDEFKAYTLSYIANELIKISTKVFNNGE